MNKTQKILMAVLAFVLVGVVALIISIKTSDNSTNTNNGTQDTYTLPGATVESGDESSAQGENNQKDLVNDSASATTKNESGKVTTTKNSSASSVQNNKKYDLNGAEEIQSQNSSFGKIRLLSAKSDGKHVYLIEATVKSDKFYYEMPAYYIVENIYYANVDGEYGDEVIVRSNTGSTGGSGTYDNIVLKITNKGIVALFDNDDAFDLTTTFTSLLKKDFNVVISNKYTGFSKTINVKDINSENYADSYWDEDGNLCYVENEGHVWIDETFCTFEPRDIDNDGMCEISCSQYASLGAHASCIGYTHLTLKYDIASKQFKIMDSGFYPQ